MNGERRGSTSLRPQGRVLATVLLAACSPVESTSGEPTTGEEVERQAVVAMLADDIETRAEGIWESPQACNSLVREGVRFERPDDIVRIGTWNLKWFPDNQNIPWLACAIAWLNVDVLTVQEIKHNEAARTAMDELLGLLTGATNDDWVYLDAACPRQEDAQRVGWLVNTSRLELVEPELVTLHELNDAIGEDGTCSRNNRMRSGAEIHVRSRSNDWDVVLVGVHQKAYPDERSMTRRMDIVAELGAIRESRAAARGDEDLIFVGDWNTQGCEDCDPTLSSFGEIGRFDEALESQELRRIRARQRCSHYFDREESWSLLDHFVVGGMELPASTLAEVHAHCAISECDGEPGDSAAGLSDHCPVTLDLDDGSDG